MIPRRELVAALLLLSLFNGVLSATPRSASRSNAETMTPVETSNEEKEGLTFRLSNGGDQPEPRPSNTLPPTTNLSTSETEEILRRLPPIKTDGNEAQAFSLRTDTPPPPRTGETIAGSFPQPLPAPAPEKPASGPLEVIRFAPEGDVSMAPHLSVTFSQPMVAVTSQEETASNVPVQINPQPSGKWRWVGTRTLLFEPEVRFPMATNYTVTVLAGTRSASGATLPTEKSWSFTTPPLSVKNSYPNVASTQSRDALMFIEFDQRIDPDKVLGAIRVSAGNQTLPIRIATDVEIKAASSNNPTVENLLTQAAKDRLLAFRAIEATSKDLGQALPAASPIKVVLNSGAPSAEGPNLTLRPYEFFFSTYDTLKVTDADCDEEGQCDPFDSFYFEFNNPLKDEIDATKVKVEPRLEDMEINVYGNNLSIDGSTRGNTTYKVTLHGSIKDEFNQTLGTKKTFTFKVGPFPRRFQMSGEDFVVMDPAALTHYSVYSINYTSLGVRLYSVTPADWPTWVANHHEQGSVPGKLVYSKEIQIKKKPNQMVETVIDLRPALKNNRGQLILTVEPFGGTPTEDDVGDDLRYKTWIEVTEIGLDAFVDDTDLVGWVTSLKDGSPLNDVEVKQLHSETSVRSGVDGLARLALPTSPSPLPEVLVASRGDDVAILPGPSYSQGSWFRKESKAQLRWFVFDDRKIYQPGEEVHVKGWLRRVGQGKGGSPPPNRNPLLLRAWSPLLVFCNSLPHVDLVQCRITTRIENDKREVSIS